MHHRTVSQILFLSSSLLATPAMADYWYLGAKGGIVFPRDTSFQGPNSRTPLFKNDQKRGWTAGGQLGYDFGRFRMESDIYYSRSSLRNTAIFAYPDFGLPGSYSASGRTDSWNFMLNALIDIIQTDRLTFSVGGGVGAARTKLNALRPSSSINSVTDSDWAFAYQGIAGMRYALSDSLDLTLDYRYAETAKNNFLRGTGSPVDAKLKSHAVLAGFAFKFGANEVAAAEPTPPPPPPAEVPPPPPVTPPPPPVAAPPPGPFIVFFDWDQSSLTAEGEKILGDAISAYKAAGTAMISVAGYTDRSGSDGYNESLAQRRGDAVKAFLQQNGVDAASISVTSYGERNPIVGTADGVREPQNRRVELKLGN